VSGLGRTTNEWRSKATELIGVKRLSIDKSVEGGSSWLVPLLPFLGHDDVLQLYDQTKSWVEGKNLLVSAIEIPAFFDPADNRHHWQGFPFQGDGPALTHFVGMSGAEDRNEVAARLPRTDPDAGMFGYDSVARDGEITDGTSNTIMLIGSGTVQSPWVQGGGATVRGAREPYFGELTGFGSKSVTAGGALVVMADGSVRTISKDIDPAVFRSLCTIHGGEAVDPAMLESMAPKQP